MTDKLLEHTTIPNWVTAIILTTIIAIFTAGWVKVDSLEEKVIRAEQVIVFRTEQIVDINKKLDEILLRLRTVEKSK